MWACCLWSAFLSLEISSKILVRSYSLHFQANTFRGGICYYVSRSTGPKNPIFSLHIALQLSYWLRLWGSFRCRILQGGCQPLLSLRERVNPEDTYVRLDLGQYVQMASETEGWCKEVWWDFQDPPSKVLKTATEHPLCWSLSFAYVHPCCKATSRSQIMQKNQHNDTDWWQVDI